MADIGTNRTRRRYVPGMTIKSSPEGETVRHGAYAALTSGIQPTAKLRLKNAPVRLRGTLDPNDLLLRIDPRERAAEVIQTDDILTSEDLVPLEVSSTRRLPLESGEPNPSPLGVSRPEHADPVLVMAYEAAAARLASQTDTLANLRVRANNLLAAAALITSFSAGLGLLNIDKAKGPLLPNWGPWALFGILMIVGVCAMFASWPTTWAYTPSAEIILHTRTLNPSENTVRRSITDKLIAAKDRNEKTLKTKSAAYQVGVVALLAEISVLVAALASR